MESFSALSYDVSKISGVRHHRTSYALNERNFGYREVRHWKERIPSSTDRNRVNKEAFISRRLEEHQSERGRNLRRTMDSPFRIEERRQSERSSRNSILRKRLDLNRDDNIGHLEERRGETRYVKNGLVNRRERVNRKLSTRKSTDFSRDEKYRADNGPASRFMERSERVKDTFREIENNPNTRSNERRIDSVDRIRFDPTTSFDFNRVSKHVRKTSTWPRIGDAAHIRRTERLNQPVNRIRKDQRRLYDGITGLSDNRKDVREVNFVSRTEEGGERRVNKREIINSRKITERIESKVRITPVSIRIRTDFLQRISRYFKNLDRFVPVENDTLPYDLEISTTNQQLNQVNFATSKSIVDMLRKKRRSYNFSELIVGVTGVVATFYFRPKTVHSFV